MLVSAVPAQQESLHFVGRAERAELDVIAVAQRLVPVALDPAGDDQAVGPVSGAPAIGELPHARDHRFAQRLPVHRLVAHLIQSIQHHHAGAALQGQAHEIAQARMTGLLLRHDLEQPVVERKGRLLRQFLGVVGQPNPHRQEGRGQPQSFAALTARQHQRDDASA